METHLIVMRPRPARMDMMEKSSQKVREVKRARPRMSIR